MLQRQLSMDIQTSIETDRLMLRPFALKDATDVQRMAGDQRVSDMTEAIPFPYEDGMAEQWISTHARAWSERSAATFAVCLRNSNKLVGCTGLEIQSRHNRAAMGYWIGYEYWKQGICTEAALKLIDFGFKELKLNRIEAIHLLRNPASGHVMRNLGMRHEGTFRDYVMKNGSYEDVEQYAILSSIA